jgi:hypothetical protein
MTIKVITPKKSAGSRPDMSCPYVVDENTGNRR